MAKMPWFRVYSEILDDQKIKRICRVTGESKALIVGVWICLLALANDSGERGRLTISDKIPYSLDDLIDETGLDEDVLKIVIDHFIELDMLTVGNNVALTYEIKNWDGRQFKSDNSSQRVKDWRAKQDETLQKHSSNIIDTESEIESEIDTDKIEIPDARSDSADYQSVWESETGLLISGFTEFKKTCDRFIDVGVTPEIFRTAIKEQKKSEYAVKRPSGVAEWAIRLVKKVNDNDKKGNIEWAHEMESNQ